MIFIIDPNKNTVHGIDVIEAIVQYENCHADFPISELIFFQGEEVDIQCTTTPKKAKK